MTLMQLRCFWTVGTMGSYTAAANTLFISQPAVSKNIAALEQELSYPLFDRSEKTVTLSPGGRRMLEYCGELIETLRSMENEAGEIRRGVASNSRIRLAGVPPMASYDVIGRVSDFSLQNPDYEVIVEEMDEDRVLFLLQSDGCDVAFCSNINISEKNYGVLKVCHEDFSVSFSKDHELAAKEELTMAELKGQKFIFSKEESMLNDLCYKAFVKTGFAPDVVLRTSSPDIATQYLMTHRCVCMGLTSELQGHPTPEHCIKHVTDSPGFDMVLCWKKRNDLSPALKSFIRFFKKSLEY
jgi:LysR family cyn operon transcriptional activator